MKTSIIALCLFTSFNGFTQQKKILFEVAATTESQSGKQLIDKITAFSSTLSKKKAPSELKFLRQVFYKTHRTFLKEYEAYSSLGQVLVDGKYDCLTGTAIYASILEMLGFNFKIIETNYHIFIVAQVDKNEVLLETTDGLHGFISDQKVITERINTYKENSPSLNKKAINSFAYRFHLLNEVKGSQLAGLLYFNQAIKEFNNHDWHRCVYLLSKSRSLYDSPRIKEIKELANLMMATTHTPHPVAALTSQTAELAEKQFEDEN